MQRMPSRAERPQAPQTSRSFSRYEPSLPSISTSLDSGARSITKTDAQSSPIRASSPEIIGEKSHSDIFESHDDETPSKGVEEEAMGSFPDGFDELPIEIQSLMERYCSKDLDWHYEDG